MIASGSVGAAWPPVYDRQNMRIKGFASTPARHEGDLHAIRLAIHRANLLHPNAERTTVRALVERNLRGSMNGTAPADVEAHFGADRAAPGFDIVYFGSNRNGRAMHASEAIVEQQDLQGIVSSVSPVSRQASSARVSEGGYRIEQIDAPRPHIMRQLLDLYRSTYQEYTFELTEASVGSMIAENNIMLAAFTPSGRIAAAMVAEQAIVPVGNDFITLYELSDYATSRQDRGRGLMTALQHEAVDRIRAGPRGNEALIYIESRAPWSSVNASIAQTGDFEYRGTLPQHCRMVSDRNLNTNSASHFENLHVWAERRME